MSTILSNTALWGLLLGLLTPLLTAVVQRPTWTRRVRTLVGYAVSTLVGAMTVLASGQMSSGTVTLTTILAVVSAAKVAYVQLWQRTGVTGTIELATSPRPPGGEAGGMSPV